MKRATAKLNRQLVLIPDGSSYISKPGQLVYKWKLAPCSRCRYLKMRPCWCEELGMTLESELMKLAPLVCHVCKGVQSAEQEKENIRKDPSQAYDGWETAYLPSND